MIASTLLALALTPSTNGIHGPAGVDPERSIPTAEVPIGVTSAGIEWDATAEGAFERALDEERLIFVSICGPEEARSERFLSEIYRDKRLVEWTSSTVNLAGYNDPDAKGSGRCKGIDGRTHSELRRIRATLEESVVTANDKGVIALPQHLWLSPRGDVLVSVPYEMTVEELGWCFHEAARRWEISRRTAADGVEGGGESSGGEDSGPEDSGGEGDSATRTPAIPAELPEGARPPRRLLLGEAYRVLDGDELGRGLTPDELEEQLQEGRSSFGAGLRSLSILKVAFTDEKEAIEHVATELTGGLLGWGGNDVLAGAVHTLGVVAPPDAWETLAEFAGHRDARVRREAAVGLEQLGSPRSLKAVRSALKKEKDAEVEAAWIRALGAVGFGDRSARKVLFNLVAKEKDKSLRLNAIFALGYLGPDEEARGVLLELLEGSARGPCAAAACALALARDWETAEAIRGVRDSIVADDEALAAQLDAALDVLDGKNLRGLADTVRDLCGDQEDRERVFFGSIGTSLQDRWNGRRGR